MAHDARIALLRGLASPGGPVDQHGVLVQATTRARSDRFLRIVRSTRAQALPARPGYGHEVLHLPRVEHRKQVRRLGRVQSERPESGGPAHDLPYRPVSEWLQ